MNETLPPFYHFGPFSLDTRRYVLLRGGEQVQLTPKVFQVLLALLRSRGRVVRKDELAREVWPDSFVGDASLAQNIFILRKIFAEEKGEHRFIMTVPGVGYTFVAAVEESDATPRGTAAVAAPSVEGSARGGGVRSVAVLPFRALEGGADELLGFGLADALVMSLSSVKNLKVRPTASSMRFGREDLDYAEAGRALGVDALLVGTFQTREGMLRVTVQLVDVAEDATIWAAKFQEELTNIFSVQDSIAGQVVRALELKLSEDERARVSKTYTDNVEAFRLYIRGRYFWNRRSVESIRKAAELARQVLDLDPTYALAYVGLADSYGLLAAQHGAMRPAEAFPLAKAAAERALEIDDRLAEAYASLGFCVQCYDWDWERSQSYYRKAIELKPNYPTAHHWLGEQLVALGRFDEALRCLDKAHELDPLSLPIGTDIAESLHHAGLDGESLKRLNGLLEMDATFTRAYVVAGKVRACVGEHAEAARLLEKAAELSRGDPIALAELAVAQAAAGKTARARELLRELHLTSESRYVSACNVAMVHAALGEREAAYRWLERAHGERDVYLMWLGVNRRFDSLRPEVRFKELLGRVNLRPSDFEKN